MKVFSGISGHDFAQERFIIVSADPKIIEQYGSVNELVWQVFLDWLPLEMRKPQGLCTVSCWSRNGQDDAMTIHFNPREVSPQMVIEYFARLGLEIVFQSTGDYETKKRQEWAELLGKAENPANVGPEGRRIVSLFEVVSEKHRNEEFMYAMSARFEKYNIYEDPTHSGEGFLWLGSWDWDNGHFLVSAEYDENQWTETKLIERLKEKFDMDVKSDLT